MADHYFSLLKTAISGRLHRENGARTTYLLECFAHSKPYYLGTLIGIRSSRQELLDGIVADREEREFYRERVFGFCHLMLGKARLDNR